MRYILAATVLLTLSNAYALGPEEQEFFGKVGDRIVALKFQDDPNVYSATDASRLARCFDEGDRVVCSDRKSKGNESIYLQSDWSSKQFAAARALYKNVHANEKTGELSRFFVCTAGCSTAIPKLLILITYGD